jgi:holin-like protein
MLQGFAVLLGFQLTGEVLSRLLPLAVPGPVVGMLLLLIALEVGLPQGEGLQRAAGGLLAHLSLLFVPAGVGIMLHAPRLLAEWPALVAALLVSTAATLGVTAWLAERLSRRGRAVERA